VICGVEDGLRAELLRYRRALEAIKAEVGTSTLAHKIAREALGLSEFRKVGEVSTPGGTTETYSRQDAAQEHVDSVMRAREEWDEKSSDECPTREELDEATVEAMRSSDEYEVTVVNPGKARPLYRHEQVAPLVAAANAWLDVGASLSFSSPQFKALRAAVAPFNSKGATNDAK
jgi:hypothetical protein